MILAVAKEIKNNENRVGLTPAGVSTLARHGHTVLVETSAGAGCGYEDSEYAAAGGTIIADKRELFDAAQMIVKVKEPLEQEYELFHAGQTLYTYLHLAPNRALTDALLRAQVTGIGYETVRLPDGSLPLLIPMSEVAGRMAPQIGANLLMKYNGGMGVLIGGVPGVEPAQVVIVGAGTVGVNAARVAMGLGAHVTVLDISQRRLAYLDDIFGGRIATLSSNEYNIARAVKKADLLIGAVLVAGAAAPKLVKEYMVKTMKKGSVIVDVAIDQGGSIETIDRITTHDKPYYEKHGVLHYSVANMPGAVPRTSTIALEAATLPYLVKLADQGVRDALLGDEALLQGLNTLGGKLTCQAVAESLGYEYTDPKSIL